MRKQNSASKSRVITVDVPTGLMFVDRMGSDLDPVGDIKVDNRCYVGIESSNLSIDVVEYIHNVTRGHDTTMYHAKPLAVKPWYSWGDAQANVADQVGDYDDIYRGQPRKQHWDRRGTYTDDCICRLTVCEVRRDGNTDVRRYWSEFAFEKLEWRGGRYQAYIREYWKYQSYVVAGQPSAESQQITHRPDPGSAGWYTVKSVHYGYHDPSFYRHLSSMWLFSEPHWFSDIAVSKGQWLEGLMREAAQDAVNQFPYFADNNLQNFAEAAEFFYRAVSGQLGASFVEVIAQMRTCMSRERFMELAGEAWLMYRYGYRTSKSDADQAKAFMDRQHISWFHATHFNGQARGAYDSTSVLCRVGMDVRLTMDPINELHYRFRQAGLDLSGYNVWDLIPFTFIVDWVVPVSDWLSDRRNNRVLQDYVFENVVWSISYIRESDQGSCSYYTRFYERLPSTIYGGSYHLMNGKASTWGRRGADIFSIFY